MKSKIYFFLSTLCFSLLIFSACGDDQVKPTAFKQSINFNPDNLNNTMYLVESPTAHSGKKICHLDSGQTFGFFYSFQVPDSLNEKEFHILIDCWVRSGKKDNKCGIVCSINNEKDSILQWDLLDASTVIEKPNEWANLNGRFILPGAKLTYGTKINIMCFNSQASAYFDVDDLDVTYIEHVPE